MTGCALAISIPTAGRRRTVPPEVCLRSPLTNTHRLCHFRHRPILPPNPSQTVSIPAVRPRPKSSNPHSKHSSISDTAPFKLEMPAASRTSELPLSRFPLRGKAGAGGFPHDRWHAVCRQKALAHIDAAAPPQEGFQGAPLKPALRIPPLGATGTASKLSASICVREKKLMMAGTSALTFTTFS